MKQYILYLRTFSQWANTLITEFSSYAESAEDE